MHMFPYWEDRFPVSLKTSPIRYWAHYCKGYIGEKLNCHVDFSVSSFFSATEHIYNSAILCVFFEVFFWDVPNDRQGKMCVFHFRALFNYVTMLKIQ